MKKKILLVVAMLALFVCLFAISVSAETPAMYIEFKVLFSGDAEYTTVYSTNAYDTWSPTLSFNYDFYLEPEQTTLVDKTTIVKIDMSDAKPYGCNRDYVRLLYSASSNDSFANVTEVKLPNYPGNFESVPNGFFKDMVSLNSVDFGSAKQFGDNSFEGCTFTEFTIPEQITRVNNNAFKGCTSLKSITVLGSTSFGSGVFSNCSELTDVNLGNIPAIGGGMFQNCSKLAKITIPETVTEIGNSAFMGTSLVSLHVPAAVTKIGYQVLENVTTFTTLTFAENSQLTFIAHRTFQGTSLSGKLVLPSGITEIDYSAFTNLALTEVVLPASLTKLGDSCFSGTSITSITLPSGLTSIGEYCFKGTPLTKLEIPSGATTIAKEAFCNCTSLEEITIPSGVTSIGGSAFYGCTSLKTITIPSGVTSIGGSAFYGCSSLEAIEIPSTVTSIGGKCFQNCTALSRVELPDGVTSIQRDTFNSCTALTYCNVPKECTAIGNYAFAGCTKLEQLDMSKAEKLKSTSSHTLNGCSSLKELIFPEGFESFGGISNASSLEKIYLPDSVTTVGGIQFAKITEFKLPLSTTKITGTIFNYCGSVATVTIHKGVTSIASNAATGGSLNSIKKVIYTGSESDEVVASIKTAFPNATITYADHCITYFGEHDWKNENKIIPGDYFAQIGIGDTCNRCQKSEAKSTIGPLFIWKGYSKCEFSDGNGITQGLYINRTALGEYKKYVSDFNFGFLATLNKNGTAYSPLPSDENVIDIKFDTSVNDYIDLKLTGITDTKAVFVFCAYVTEGEKLYYLEGGTTSETVIGVSYETAQNIN